MTSALVHTQPPDPSGGDLPEPARPAQALIVALRELLDAEKKHARHEITDADLAAAVERVRVAEAELDRHWMCLDQKEKQAK